MRRGVGVHAPFKSPLRTRNTNTKPSNAEDLPNGPEPSQSTHNKQKPCDDKQETMSEEELDREIDRLMKKLSANRNEPLDVEKELAMWRQKMHSYNEAKDVCLRIFGILAEAKGCLVRDLYDEYGLKLTD